MKKILFLFVSIIVLQLSAVVDEKVYNINFDIDASATWTVINNFSLENGGMKLTSTTATATSSVIYLSNVKWLSPIAINTDVDTISFTVTFNGEDGTTNTTNIFNGGVLDASSIPGESFSGEIFFSIDVSGSVNDTINDIVFNYGTSSGIVATTSLLSSGKNYSISLADKTRATIADDGVKLTDGILYSEDESYATPPKGILWESPDKNIEVVVDFDSKYKIDSVRAHFLQGSGPSFPRTVWVYCWDGVEWQSLGSTVSTVELVAGTSSVAWMSVAGVPSVATKVKLVFENKDQWGNAISFLDCDEVEIYGSPIVGLAENTTSTDGRMLVDIDDDVVSDSRVSSYSISSFVPSGTPSVGYNNGAKFGYTIIPTSVDGGDLTDDVAVDGMYHLTFFYNEATTEDVSFFYWDGVEYNELRSLKNSDGRYISANVNFFGSFAVFEVDKLRQITNVISVNHRIFSPNGDNKFDQIIFTVLDSVADELKSIEIFDVNGTLVKVLGAETINGAGVFVWDGRDIHGDIVKIGNYIYRGHLGETTVRGVLVVVK